MAIAGYETDEVHGNQFSHLLTREILRAVTLYDCTLSRFPDEVLQRRELEVMRFEDCVFTVNKVLDALESFPYFRTLELKDCGISEFPEVVPRLAKLQELDLSGSYAVKNNTKFIPPSITRLPKLHTLNLSWCRLTQYPDIISELSNLFTLGLSGNSISSIPVSIARLTRLSILNLSHCGLTQYPESISKLSGLRRLDLSHNSIQSITPSIAELTKLSKLNLSWCGLTQYPCSVSELSGLQDLNLSNNRIESIPTSIARFNKLYRLILGSCGLIRYPDSVSVHTKMYHLDLSHNNIESIPPSISCLSELLSLDLNSCGLTQYPDSVSELYRLKTLNLYGNHIKSIPSSIIKLTRLETLNLSWCGLREFPGFPLPVKDLKLSGNYLESLREPLPGLNCIDISKCTIVEFPHWLYTTEHVVDVKDDGVSYQILTESFIKKWNENPAIINEKKLSNSFSGLIQPPYAVYEQGPKACISYYRDLSLDTAMKCSVFNVVVIGRTEAGKTSLVETIRKGHSVLVHPEDRTVVVNNVQIKKGDALLQVTDFGGHDIYEIGFPIFLKASNQITILAVKLPEYNEESHDKLVTKYLSSTIPHLRTGKMFVVGTQADLCTEEEISKKCGLLKEKIKKWVDEELKFLHKSNRKETDGYKHMLSMKHFEFLVISSQNMRGINDLEEKLFQGAVSTQAILPEKWKDLYSFIYNQKMETGQYVQYKDCEAMYQATNIDDFDGLPVCLQFLHNTGMILWYGNRNEKLKEIIFHDSSFLVELLQHLFRHNLATMLRYDMHHKVFPKEIVFQKQVVTFTQTGIMSTSLLRCMWQKYNFTENQLESMMELLYMFELCYKEKESASPTLRFPWFAQKVDNENVVHNAWPIRLQPGAIQYTFKYCFCHKIPATVYERFCVRLQSYLVPGGHIRFDFKNVTYVEQDEVQILLQKDQKEPHIVLQFRCDLGNLKNLPGICLKLNKDMDTLCDEFSGVYINAYLLCPHCVLHGSSNPTKRPLEELAETRFLDRIPCDQSGKSEKIPASLIFLKALESDRAAHHMGLVESFYATLSEEMQPTVSDDLLLAVSKRMSTAELVHSVGVELGVESHTRESEVYNNPRDINMAGYRVLQAWKKVGLQQQRGKRQMLEELKKAICNEAVGLNNLTVELKDYFVM